MIQQTNWLFIQNTPLWVSSALHEQPRCRQWCLLEMNHHTSWTKWEPESSYYKPSLTILPYNLIRSLYHRLTLTTSTNLFHRSRNTVLATEPRSCSSHCLGLPATRKRRSKRFAIHTTRSLSVPSISSLGSEKALSAWQQKY